MDAPHYSHIETSNAGASSLASHLSSRKTGKEAAEKLSVDTGVRSVGNEVLTSDILRTKVSRAESGSKSREQTGNGV